MEYINQKVIHILYGRSSQYLCFVWLGMRENIFQHAQVLLLSMLTIGFTNCIERTYIFKYVSFIFLTAN